MFAMPTREGWALIPDHFKTNGAAFHAARRAAKMPEDYKDKAAAEKNAEILTKQLGFKVHVCQCIY